MRQFFPYLSAPYKRWGRRLRLLFLLFMVIAFFYFWHCIEETKFNAELDAEADKQEKVQAGERIGEQITYDVYLGRIRLGYAKYHHLRKTNLNNKPAYLITFETKVVRFRDRETIYCDPETFLPLRVERKISQPIKPEKIVEVYDQENFTVTITRKRFGQTERVIRNTGPMHNSILLPFFVRNAPDLKIGWSFVANLPQRKYTIKLVSIEEIKIASGKFEAYYFESEPKKIKIWIGTDEKRIPLRIEGTGGIGYKLVMKEYIGPEK